MIKNNLAVLLGILGTAFALYNKQVTAAIVSAGAFFALGLLEGKYKNKKRIATDQWKFKL
jgi:hypothetical protein